MFGSSSCSRLEKLFYYFLSNLLNYYDNESFLKIFNKFLIFFKQSNQKLKIQFDLNFNFFHSVPSSKHLTENLKHNTYSVICYMLKPKDKV